MSKGIMITCSLPQNCQMSNKLRFVFRWSQGSCLDAMNLDIHPYRLCYI